MTRPAHESAAEAPNATGVPCPACGAPLEPSLAEPDATVCPSCSRRGAPTGAAAVAVAATRRAVQDLGQQRATLSDRQERAVSSTRGALSVVAAVSALLALPSLLVSIVVGALEREAHRGPSAWPHLPWILLVPVTLAALLVVRRAVAEVESLCGALAPRTPGEPARCHACGAPLDPPNAEQPLVHCGHCRAPNLLSPSALDRATARVKHVDSALAGHLGARLAALDTRLDRGLRAVLLAGGIGLVLLVAAGWRRYSTSAASDTAAEGAYAVRVEQDRLCVERTDRVDTSTPLAPGATTGQQRLPLRPSLLRGRTLLDDHGAPRGTISDVTFDGLQHWVELGDGERVPMTGACISRAGKRP